MLAIFCSYLFEFIKQRPGLRASTVATKVTGPKTGTRRLDIEIEHIIDAVLTDWLPRQRFLAHPLKDIVLEIRQRCRKLKLSPPSRFTVARRWSAVKEEQARARADQPKAKIPPGEFRVETRWKWFRSITHKRMFLLSTHYLDRIRNAPGYRSRST